VPAPLTGSSPLRALPNAVVTPHIAWYAPNALDRYFRLTAQEFARFFDGEPLQYELTRRMVEIRHSRI
jgi:D-3-phosphoglycerate dehydrogenase